MEPYYASPSGDVVLWQGDATAALRALPAESVHCCISSPPYWNLRSYLPNGHTDKATELGSEATPDAYVAALVAVFREVKRVLRDDGTLWLNIGDGYNSSAQFNGHKRKDGKASALLHSGDPYAERVDEWPGHRPLLPGLAAKQLLMMPSRVALALQADGWWIRSMIPWLKRCLSGGAVVYARTQKGEMPMTVKDLVRLRPETVQLWNGERWTQAVGWAQTERPDDALEIELRSGERIGCTPDHRWPTQRGNVEARDLRLGDVVRTCRIPEPAQPARPWSPDDAQAGWFVGLYIAEGCRDKRSIHISGHIRETERLDKLQTIATAYHGHCRQHPKLGNGCTIDLYGPMLGAILDQYVSGEGARKKHLSGHCWERSDKFLANVLEGYLSGDGHWDKRNGRWRLGFTQNDALAQDLRTLCARLGVVLRLRRCQHMLNGEKVPGYRGEIRFDVERQVPPGGFVRKEQGEIVAIRQSRARRFWDIAVEDEPHLFALASGVLTHNSAMPESATDRPSTATEYIFLLTKSGAPTFWTHRDLAGVTARPAPDYRWVDPADPRRESREPVPGWKRVNLWAGHDYFYDATAVALPGTPYRVKQPDGWDTGSGGHGSFHRNGREHGSTRDGERSGRNRRNADWWFDSLRAILDGATGLLADEDGAPLALPVNPAAYPGAHFATFAPKLVEPMVLASTSAKGCCPACGAPWVRVVSSATGGAIGRTWTTHEHADDAGQGNAKLGGWSCRDYRPGQTTGWRAGCGCDAGDPIPCTVLDPFCGSGTVSLVARKHGRHSWGADLSAAYLDLARERLGQLALPGLVAD